MSLLNSTYRYIKSARAGASHQSHQLELTVKMQQNTHTNRMAFFLSQYTKAIMFLWYIYSVCVKEAGNLALEIIYLPTTCRLLQGISNFPYSLFYHRVPLSDHLSAKNLRACWTKSYHSVNKTAEIYDKEMKKKQL